MGYEDQKYITVQEVQLTGNDSTTMLLTPQAGTGAETKAHTTTLKKWSPGKAITLKKLGYLVQTAQTGAGNNMTINVYNGTTSVGTLAVTTQTAGTLVQQSANMDSNVTATGTIYLTAISTTTASDANCAVGTLNLTYQDTFNAG